MPNYAALEGHELLQSIAAEFRAASTVNDLYRAGQVAAPFMEKIKLWNSGQYEWLRTAFVHHKRRVEGRLRKPTETAPAPTARELARKAWAPKKAQSRKKGQNAH